MTFIKDQDEVAAGIRAVAAAGLTPGHTAFHIESDGKRLLLGADFCNTTSCRCSGRTGRFASMPTRPRRPQRARSCST